MEAEPPTKVAPVIDEKRLQDWSELTAPEVVPTAAGTAEAPEIGETAASEGRDSATTEEKAGIPPPAAPPAAHGKPQRPFQPGRQAPGRGQPPQTRWRDATYQTSSVAPQQAPTNVRKVVLLNCSEPGEIRVAILENGELSEIFMERKSRGQQAGNIYKGRVVNVEPSLQAAFIDLGAERNGFLHASDCIPPDGGYGDILGRNTPPRAQRAAPQQPPQQPNQRFGKQQFTGKPFTPPRQYNRAPAIAVLEEPQTPLVNAPLADLAQVPLAKNEISNAQPPAWPSEIQVPSSPPAESPLPLTPSQLFTPAIEETRPSQPPEIAAPAVTVPPIAETAAADRQFFVPLPNEPQTPDLPGAGGTVPPLAGETQTANIATQVAVQPAAPGAQPVQPNAPPHGFHRHGRRRRRRGGRGRSGRGRAPGGASPMIAPNTPHTPVPAQPIDSQTPTREMPAVQVPGDMIVSMTGADASLPPSGNESTPVPVEGDVEAAVGEMKARSRENETKAIEIPEALAFQRVDPLATPSTLEDADGEDEVDGDGEEESDTAESSEVSQEQSQTELAPPALAPPLPSQAPQNPPPRRHGRSGRDRQFERRYTIQEMLREGQEVLVQVAKEGIGQKGPALTTYVSIPGRYLVLMPAVSRLGVSKRIESEEQRRALKSALNQLNPPKDMGVIVRTAGTGRSKDELQRDLDYLMRTWDSMQNRARQVKAPALIYQEGDIITRVFRDALTDDVVEIIIDDPQVLERAREFLRETQPGAERKLKLHADAEPLFHKHNVETQMQRLFNRKVNLRSGGSIVIEQTEALVAIDVNTGRFREKRNQDDTILQTNLEAAREIARQLRLRDIGGLVMIDFIDMEIGEHRRKVERELKAHLARDKARINVLPVSPLGVVEMTRQRIRHSLRKTLFDRCPHCSGSGHIKSAESLGLEMLREIKSQLKDQSVRKVKVSLNSVVGFAILNHFRRDLVRMEEAKGVTIEVCGDPGVPLSQMQVSIAREGGEWVLKKVSEVDDYVRNS